MVLFKQRVLLLFQGEQDDRFEKFIFRRGKSGHSVAAHAATTVAGNARTP